MRFVMAAFLLCAIAACTAPRDRVEGLWPGSSEAIFIIRNGRPADEAIPQRATAWRWDGRSSTHYRDGAVEVHEDSTLDKDGLVWRRRFRVEGLAAGIELVVRVPLHDRTGHPLAIEVNGAPAHAEPGALELVVQLARDEATVVTVRSAE